MFGRWSVIAALAVIVMAAAPGGNGSNAARGSGLIRITDRLISYSRVDVRRQRTTAGDVEITQRLLYNKRITPKPIGHAEIVCTFTGGRTRQCNGTFSLPGGKLVVSGTILFRQFFQLAVVGGTGLYANARGTLTVTLLTHRHVTDIVLFRLL